MSETRNHGQVEGDEQKKETGGPVAGRPFTLPLRPLTFELWDLLSRAHQADDEE